jgi:hypothetical protein
LTQSETAIAVSGQFILAAFNDGRGVFCPKEHATVGWAYSSDGGATWTDGGWLPSGDGLDDGDPWLGVSPDGRTFYLSGLYSSGIAFYRGATLGTSIVWSEPTIITGQGFLDKEAFTVDELTGTIYLSYVDAFFRNQLLLRRSSDGRQTWSDPITLVDGGLELGFSPFLAVDRQGSLYVAYNLVDSAFQRYVAVSKSTDGQSFETLIRFPYRTASVTFVDRSSVGPQLAIDRSGGAFEGRIYVTWHALSEEGILRPYLAHAEAGGRNWSVPLPINGDSSDAFHWWPSIALDAAGGVNVAFYDRHLNPGTALTDLFLAQSTDGGETFQTSRVTDQSSDWSNVAHDPGITYAGDYISAAVSGDDVVVVWADTRDGDPDVYFARLPGASSVGR